MELLFINRFFYPDTSATSQLLSDLCFNLASKGHQVKVITSRRNYSEPAVVYPLLETIHGVEIHRVSTWGGSRHGLISKLASFLSFYLFAGFLLFRLAHAQSTVIVKTDPPLFGFIVSVASRFRGFSYVNWLQDVYPDVALRSSIGHRMRWLTPMLSRVRDITLRGAQLNVVIGERMKQRLLDWGVKPKAIETIPNWSDVTELQPDPQRPTSLRAEWGLVDKFVVMYSGNMGAAHDHEAIFKAINDAPDQEVFFLFVGGGSGMEALQKSLTSHAQNVSFKPYVPRERLTESLSVADIHLISLRPEMEGLIVPSKVYGVLGVGRPFVFIGDPQGELAQMVTLYDVGTVVPANDHAALISAIQDYRANQTRRAEHGRNARQLYEAQFDRLRALSKWESALKSSWSR